jgi:hypothetical protein
METAARGAREHPDHPENRLFEVTSHNAGGEGTAKVPPSTQRQAPQMGDEMNKVPQLMSDRPRMVASAGKFIVEAMIPAGVYGVLAGDRIVHDPDATQVTIFETLDEADAAAKAADARGEKFRNVAFRHRTVHLVNNLNGPRIWRAA